MQVSLKLNSIWFDLKRRAVPNVVKLCVALNNDINTCEYENDEHSFWINFIELSIPMPYKDIFSRNIFVFLYFKICIAWCLHNSQNANALFYLKKKLSKTMDRIEVHLQPYIGATLRCFFYKTFRWALSVSFFFSVLIYKYN